MSHFCMITDTHQAHVNGVMRFIENIEKTLIAMGHRVSIFSADDASFSIPMPGYNEVKLGFCSKRKMLRYLLSSDFDHVHIVTPEGPIGRSALAALKTLKQPYTTAYHTKIDAYIKKSFPFIPLNFIQQKMKKQHQNSISVMTPSKTLYRALREQNYPQLDLCHPGFDDQIFFPKPSKPIHKKPIALCVSRISLSQKNLTAFFELDIPHHKIMVGQGPDLQWAKRKYPHIEFTGLLQGSALADMFRNADVFVFPALYETFGMVMIEAMACGTPVAAFDTPGPQDIVVNGVNGFLGHDLKHSVAQCQQLSPEIISRSVSHYTWQNSAIAFLACAQKAHFNPINKPNRSHHETIS